MPYYVLVEMLGPVIEMIGYLILIVSVLIGVLSPFFIYVFLMAYMYGIFFSLSAILFEAFSYKRYSRIREVSRLIIYSFFEQIGYRQITVWWRMISFFNFKKGSSDWGTIKRNSFNSRED